MNTATPNNETLLGRLLWHAEQRPGSIAYTMNGASLSYRQLAERVTTMAARLRGEVPLGSIVILSSCNRLEFPVAFFGILAAGCSVFPVSSEAADAELLHAAQEAGATAAVGDGRMLGVLRSALRVAIPMDGLGLPNVATPFHNCSDLLLQSSGTTGLPKIVRRSARSLDAVAAGVAEAIPFTREDRVLMTVPLTHSYGLEHGLLAPVWAGSTVHLCNGLNLPVVIRELGTGGITILPGVPSTFEMLASAADSGLGRRTLRTAYSAGAPLPRSVFDAFGGRFGVPVTQLYGATEVGSVTFNPATDNFDPASVGLPLARVSVRILDVSTHAALPTHREGTVAIRAESMFSGYLREDAELIDGYFLTGDLGHLDGRGCLFITGRLKLLIDVGGRKVNPLEVEAVLAQHPAVAACVVIAVRQSETVFRLKAIVTPRDAARPPAPAELRELVKKRLAAYKVPRIFEIRPTLPRSATGKVMRHLVEAV